MGMDPWSSDYVFEAEVRDMTDHYSDDGDASGFNVTADTNFHDDLSDYLKHVVYIHDTHQTAFDVDIESAAGGDDTYSGPVVEQTLSLTASDDTDKLTFPDGIGRLRLNFKGSSASASPSEGRTRVTVHSVGRER